MNWNECVCLSVHAFGVVLWMAHEHMCICVFLQIVSVDVLW